MKTLQIKFIVAFEDYHIDGFSKNVIWSDLIYIPCIYCFLKLLNQMQNLLNQLETLN